MTYLRVIIFTHSLKTLYKIPMSTWVQSFAPKVYGLVLIPLTCMSTWAQSFAPKVYGLVLIPIDIPKGWNVNL